MKNEGALMKKNMEDAAKNSLLKHTTQVKKLNDEIAQLEKNMKDADKRNLERRADAVK
jgi:hypothetical protein